MYERDGRDDQYRKKNLKQLAEQPHETRLDMQQKHIMKERNAIKELIRNDETKMNDQLLETNWFEQDLLVNVLLFLTPGELFIGCCGLVCKYWNQLIVSPEFAKYYFNLSFCVSKPFIHDENEREFDDIENVLISDDDPSNVLEYAKSFHQGMRELGIQPGKNWKNNFHSNFLTLISMLENGDNNQDHSQTIEKLLEPLNQSQITKLNLILRKLKFSKLLTNSIKVHPNIIAVFNDSGTPYLVVTNGTAVWFRGKTIFKVSNNIGLGGALDEFIPPQCSEPEKKTLIDVLCGFFPRIVESIKFKQFKKPLSPYLIFSLGRRLQIHRQTVHPLSVLDEIPAQWEKMSETEKKPFVDEADKKQKALQEQLDAYRYIISGLD